MNELHEEDERIVEKFLERTEKIFLDAYVEPEYQWTNYRYFSPIN